MNNSKEEILKKLTEQKKYYKNQLLNLLKTWHFYQTEVLQRVTFSYENAFGNVETEIEEKDKTAKSLERKYQFISAKLKNGEKITKKYVEFVDNLIEKEKKRDQNATKNTTFNVTFSTTNPKNPDKKLETEYNDNFDISQIYRQIVKRLHPDIVGETTAFRSFWDNVQNCYKKFDIERLKMFYLVLCQEDKKNLEDEIDELKKCIEKQKKALTDLQHQEPFCFDGKFEDNNWVVERKNFLREKLTQINRKISQNNRLIRTINVVD
jgi:hypothetical protein